MTGRARHGTRGDPRTFVFRYVCIAWDSRSDSDVTLCLGKRLIGGGWWEGARWEMRTLFLDRSPCGHRPDDNQCVAVPQAPSSVLVLALQLLECSDTGRQDSGQVQPTAEAWMLAGHGWAHWTALGFAWRGWLGLGFSWMGWGREGALRTVCHGCCWIRMGPGLSCLPCQSSQGQACVGCQPGTVSLFPSIHASPVPGG